MYEFEYMTKLTECLQVAYETNKETINRGKVRSGQYATNNQILEGAPFGYSNSSFHLIPNEAFFLIGVTL